MARSLPELLTPCLRAPTEQSWSDFVDAIRPAIEAAVRRTVYSCGDSAAPAVEEIVQNVFVRLLEHDRRVLRLPVFSGHDQAMAYLRAMARSAAIDHFRRAHASKRGSALELVSSDDHAGLVVPAIQEKATQVAEIESSLLRVTAKESAPRDRLVFLLHYRQGWTAQAISELPQVKLSAKGVDTLLRRLVSGIRADLKIDGAQ